MYAESSMAAVVYLHIKKHITIFFQFSTKKEREKWQIFFLFFYVVSNWFWMNAIVLHFQRFHINLLWYLCLTVLDCDRYKNFLQFCYGKNFCSWHFISLYGNPRRFCSEAAKKFYSTSKNFQDICSSSRSNMWT